MQPQIYAHRGSSHRFAEHTRAAYLQALADGADGVECDVHLTRDLELVCHHDGTVDRTSSGTGAVGDKTLAQLRRLDFSSWKGVPIPVEYGADSEQFLTLRELVRILQGAGRPVGFAIELKHPSPYGRRLEEEVLGFLMGLGWDPETSTLGNIKISFMSFDPGSVKYLARHVPVEQLCQLVADVDPEEVKAHLGFGPLTRSTIVATLRRSLHEGQELIRAGAVGIAGPSVGYVRAHRREIEQLLAAGSRFRVWTVDEPADVALMLELGIQEITTNKPAEVRSLLS